MTKNDIETLDKVEQIVKECTKKPEIYLSCQKEITEELKSSTKHLYDLAVTRRSFKYSKSDVLPELIIDDFDGEQIWQQLELENNQVFNRGRIERISRVLASTKSLELPLRVTKETEQPEESDSDDDEDENKEDKSEGDEEEPMSEDDDDDIEEKSKKAKTTSVKKRKRTTEVDDKFFKLDELDEYLNKEDKKEGKAKRKKNNDESSDEDNESIDFFNNFSDLDDEEEEEEDEIKNGKSLKYGDFFDSPESGGEEEHTKDNEDIEDVHDEEDVDEYQNYIKEALKNPKKVKFNLLNNSDDSDSKESVQMDEDEKEENTDGTKSSLEARQERLQKRIAQLEKEAISEKPWQLKGEASALTRPQNSLLEEYVEFDSTARPAPLMTEQTTLKLEDIIKGRIKDKTWDDVEKKFKPVETPMEYKKKLIMNQEKSKESLAQIYENEYIKQREALNPEKDEQEKEESQEHIEIKEKMHSLFRKLEALSNFHYTPKPAKPEIKIISNVAAVNMEEVAPVATSEATLLAPEEVQAKQKGDLLGKSERTKTDMKRERRKKKLRQHARALVEDTKQKKSLKKSVKQITGRNVINVDDKNTKHDKTIKSSTAFFAQLQDQVESSIKAKKNPTAGKKKKDQPSAVRLKL